MFEVTIIKSFSAAHILSQVGGKCEELHGHNFKVELSVGAGQLNEAGLLIDFRLAKKWLDELLEEIDHKHLNEIPFFANLNPSAENVARYIAGKIEPQAKKEGVKVTSVKVWESENAYVTYKGD
ncbi:MAG TPA: 6-carboxytetrahydropterin synthase [Deltaproteobacteria bacterium]|nr:6-carboxytetrahydropterin synthase [Deltaproteobacteria bacterium]